MYKKILFALLILALLVPFFVTPASAHTLSVTRTCTKNFYESGTKVASQTVTANFYWNSNHIVKVNWATSSTWAAAGYNWQDKRAILLQDGDQWVGAVAQADLYRGTSLKFDNSWARAYAIDGSNHTRGCDYKF